MAGLYKSGADNYVDSLIDEINFLQNRIKELEEENKRLKEGIKSIASNIDSYADYLNDSTVGDYVKDLDKLLAERE